MKSVIWILCCSLALSACGQTQEPAPTGDTIQTDTTTEGVYQDVNPAEAEQLLANEKLLILDVRTPGEYEGGRLEGAQNIDVLNVDFESSLAQLDKSATYLVYCRSGGRSAKAMSIMQEKGFTAVYNMEGGITAWMAQSKPTVQ